MEISTTDSIDGWTKEQWVAQGRNGYHEVGSPGDGKNGVPYTTCVAMTGSPIRNVRFGVALMGNNSTFSHNELDHFGDDGMDYAASNISITHNYFHDNFDIGDGNHEDVAQGRATPETSPLQRLLEHPHRQQPRHSTDGPETRVRDLSARD
jgi:hypothetical protein